MTIPGNFLRDNLFMTPVKEQEQGPTLRYFKTPADFCLTAFTEARALFPDGANLRLLLSHSYINFLGNNEFIDIPCGFTSVLPPDVWMLVSDDEKGDIFYCPGA